MILGCWSAITKFNYKNQQGVPGGSVVKNLPDSAGEMDKSLLQEGFSFYGATKTVYWACALEPRKL